MNNACYGDHVSRFCSCSAWLSRGGYLLYPLRSLSLHLTPPPPPLSTLNHLFSIFPLPGPTATIISPPIPHPAIVKSTSKAFPTHPPTCGAPSLSESHTLCVPGPHVPCLSLLMSVLLWGSANSYPLVYYAMRGCVLCNERQLQCYELRALDFSASEHT